ncbi:ABC transporter ATP-binding protein [Natronosalvus amylolyticus]|uniref:ABC transporter ATP-binding protein n=1 Tax=Natronosalvus amylolyticus TaxID=2961994 RepID=UPI0020C957B2|nr:ABC transporter ATP-binding protein [Natronosalvus amylolyticus]
MAQITLEGLTKDYGEVVANDDVTFDVESGEIFGYLGPNGAGKTTTIRMLMGYISPTGGGARVLGADCTEEEALIEAKRKIGYLPDDPQFDETATGWEILDLHGAIKGNEREAELIDLFDPPLERPIREYSHGNVRKLGLITAFMHDPELVILDEPTGGLDPLMKQRFAEFLRAEQEQGLTVFFSSHSLGEVRRLCDRVGIIRGGSLVTVEPVESLLDRSGKVVRLVATSPIPVSVFEESLEGVFDLEKGHRGKISTQESTPPKEQAETPTISSKEQSETPTQDTENPSGDSDTNTESNSYREYTFTYTGDVNELLSLLEEYDLLDCTIEEAPLEDVFLRFYGGADTASDIPRGGADV